MNEVFNIKELANYLHCSKSTVRKLVRNKAIPNFRIANRIFFRKNFIDVWIDNQCNNNCEVTCNEEK